MRILRRRYCNVLENIAYREAARRVAAGLR
jgi:hypothetical protein